LDLPHILLTIITADSAPGSRTPDPSVSDHRTVLLKGLLRRTQQPLDMASGSF